MMLFSLNLMMLLNGLIVIQTAAPSSEAAYDWVSVNS